MARGITAKVCNHLVTPMFTPQLKSKAARYTVLTVASAWLSACVTVSTPELVADIRPSSVPVTVDSVAGDNDLVRLARGQNQGILNTYGGTYSDAKLELSVARIVGKLVAVSPNPTQTYNITILNSPQINAFALPGGYLYITRGLLALANDSSELAAVIAHELAHTVQQEDHQGDHEPRSAATDGKPATRHAAHPPARAANVLDLGGIELRVALELHGRDSMHALRAPTGRRPIRSQLGEHDFDSDV